MEIAQVALWGVVLVGVLVTGLIGSCPLYRLLGINTCVMRRA